ncbi:hypothetical protein CYLTODRAFT_277675 [Cylindrobasidium torrendii FP15055 ss-10]|uniref:Uncharacterized protein n=1 Tax=Cylindrobasidium torrendii FP15055 ss-10 TaxID=1314674 RepID=A0A0D7BE68_9AGAR|nr:hypothetical protein CYLTODRAFT_277675 [Cylindrobasidium torrendii FP15055 ss-10]
MPCPAYALCAFWNQDGLGLYTVTNDKARRTHRAACTSAFARMSPAGSALCVQRIHIPSAFSIYIFPLRLAYTYVSVVVPPRLWFWFWFLTALLSWITMDRIPSLPLERRPPTCTSAGRRFPSDHASHSHLTLAFTFIITTQPSVHPIASPISDILLDILLEPTRR